MISWTWPPGYGCEMAAPVGNTFDKPCVWPFSESCGYWSEKWAFQQIKLDKFGTCKGTGNWTRAAQKRTTWRISQTKLSFSVPKWSRTIFLGHLVSPGLCLKWAACGDTGFICSFIFSFMNSFFPSLIHPFSNRNICVAFVNKDYLRKIVCQQGRPLFIFWHHAIAVGVGSVVHSIGSMWRNDLWRRSHQRHLEPRQHPRQKLFLLFNQSAEKLFPGDAWRD